MTEKPRRSTRLPIKIPVTQAEKAGSSADGDIVPSLSTKRKAPESTDPQTQLRNILENPKSILTTMDISELLNANSWDLIPENSQQALLTLLPPSALDECLPGSDESLLGNAAFSSVQPRKLLNLNIFNDVHFLDAAHTFQDHLYSGWFTATHRAKLDKYIAGIRDGTLAAPWKDEVWEQENPRPNPASGGNTTLRRRDLAGASADLKLADLVKEGVVRGGDILAYHRKFSGLGHNVQKDVIIQSTDPLNYTLTVLMPKSTTCSLPPSLTRRKPGEPGSDIEMAIVSTPHELETQILELDGRVKKNQRPNYNAWKSFTVYRWRDGRTAIDTTDQRGGRDVHGVLFYLRSSLYYDQ